MLCSLLQLLVALGRSFQNCKSVVVLQDRSVWATSILQIRVRVAWQQLET